MRILKIFWVVMVFVLLTSSKHAPSDVQCERPDAWYQAYNEQYFDRRLPKNTVVDYSEHDERFMATTFQTGGQFHIALNPKFTAAARVAHLMLLHEMCHIKTWDETDDSGSNHGKQWRACMLTLEMEGANRAILIDAYEGR